MPLFMVLEQLLEGFCLKQRRVTTNDDGLTINVTENILGLHNCVTGPQLLLLQDIAGPVAEALLNRLSPEANDRNDIFNVGLLQLGQDVVDHRLTADLVQDLV